MRRLIAAALLLAACGDDVDPGAPDAAPPLRLAWEEIDLGRDDMGVTAVTFIPGTDELLLLEKSGHVSHYQLPAGAGAATLLGELTVPDVRDVEDCGLLTAVFDPVTTDGTYVLFGHCLAGDGVKANRVVRMTWDPTDYAATVASAVTILDVDDPGILGSSTSHNLGRLTFDADGRLWVPHGDRSLRPRSPDPTSNLGKVLRIVPSRVPGTGGYQPAPDNPFIDHPSNSPDVYAMGLRHPWTISLDRLGRLWAGDIGSNRREEIDLIDGPGQNLGWPANEGPCEEDCDGLVDPVVVWDRSSGHEFIQDDPDAVPAEGRIVWLGPEYVPSDTNPYAGLMDGVMLFADVCVGYVRALRVHDDGSTTHAHVGHLANLIDADQGPDGHVYALTYGSCLSSVTPPGKLWRAVLDD